MKLQNLKSLMAGLAMMALFAGALAQDSQSGNSIAASDTEVEVTAVSPWQSPSLQSEAGFADMFGSGWLMLDPQKLALQRQAAQKNAAAAAQIARIRAEKNRRQLELIRARELKNFSLIAGMILVTLGGAGLWREWKRHEKAMLEAKPAPVLFEVRRKPEMTKARYLKTKMRREKAEYQREMKALVKQARQEESELIHSDLEAG